MNATRLRSLVGSENVLTDAAELVAYGYDNSGQKALPCAIVLPTTHAQVRAAVDYCNETGTALVPRGRGTGTTGASVPLNSALVMSLERMDQIVEIDTANRLAVVEPGVTNGALQRQLGSLGFFWPPDPTSADYCTVGGNLACNSAGPKAVKYGTPRENTLGVVAVTGDGKTLRSGVRTTKGVVGYDLTRLLIGSEGTLGIITQATLKLSPLPEAQATLRACFENVEHAARAVSAIMAQPDVPCTLEFIDEAALQLANAYRPLGLPEACRALLIIEVDGTAARIHDRLEAIADVTRSHHAVELQMASEKMEIEKLWSARKALSPSLRKIAPRKINEDVVVPVSRLPELIAGTQVLSRRHAIPIVNFGHAGNGNIHVNLLYDPDNPEQARQTQPCLDALFDLVLSLDGSLSGEHGVGIAKRDYVARELDKNALEMMRQIKSLFDPAGILNPGKTLPP